MSHLKRFELESSELHDHFYETAASVGSSAKIENMLMDEIDLSERPAASRHLAEFICKMSHLKSFELKYGELHDAFYETAASFGSTAKIGNLLMENDSLSERPAASRHLAEFICKMSDLKTCELKFSEFHDHFYETAASVGSSVKIEHLLLFDIDLFECSAASRHLAQFICKMPHLKTFDFNMCELHEDFYETAASVGPSAKIANLLMDKIDLKELPAASSHLAHFICKMPHLNIVEFYECKLHGDFYETAASLGPSAKIEKLLMDGINLKELPAASRHLAQFICKLSHLKTLQFAACHFDEDFYQNAVPLGGKVDDQSNILHTSLNEIVSNDGTQFTIELSDELETGHLQEVHVLQGATELIIQKRENARGIANLKGEPSSMLRALMRAFPQLTKITFSDIDIGNADMKLILEPLRASQNLHLKNFSVIRCNTDEGLDAFVHDPASNIQVELEHGEPR